MNFLRQIVIFVLLLPIVAFAKSSTQLNKVVAIVNDEVITAADLQHQVDVVTKQIQASNTALPSPSKLETQVLGRMIDVELQLQVAKKGKLKISDADLDAGIEKMIKANHADMATLKSSLAQQGITFEEFKENIRKEMTLSKLQQEIIGRDIVITDEQVRDFMKNNQNKIKEGGQFHLVDLLIPLSENPTVDELKTANAKAAELRQHFTTGDDLGWRPLNALPEIFAKEAVNMKPGDVAGPIRTANGLHLIKLLEIRGGASGDNMEKQVRAMLYRQRFTQAADSYVQQLRAKSYVKTFTA